MKMIILWGLMLILLSANLFIQVARESRPKYLYLVEDLSAAKSGDILFTYTKGDTTFIGYPEDYPTGKPITLLGN